MAFLDKLKELFSGGGSAVPDEVDEVSPPGQDRAGTSLASERADREAADRPSIATDEGYKPPPAERDADT